MSLDKGVNPRLLGIETRDHSHPGSLRRSDNVTDGVPTGTKGSTKGLDPIDLQTTYRTFAPGPSERLTTPD